MTSQVRSLVTSTPFVLASRLTRSDLSSGRPASSRRPTALRSKLVRKSLVFVPPEIGALIDRAEEAIDELEQAAFVASLAPKEIDGHLLSGLSKLAATALTATEAAASGLAAAIQVPEGHRADSEDALAAVTRLIDAEHAADDQERAITALVFGGKFDLPTSLSMLDLARAIERATDRFAGFGHLLRQHIMADLSA
jgi:uncharacterized protein Yka (UPF0111/DUF47 family)